MSIERLSDIVGRAPRYLAYPFGPTSDAAMHIVERLGFEAAFTIERPHQGLFAFERAWIRPRHGLRVFALKTSGIGRRPGVGRTRTRRRSRGAAVHRPRPVADPANSPRRASSPWIPVRDHRLDREKTNQSWRSRLRPAM